MSLPAHPAKRAWLLSVLVINSKMECNTKSRRIRLSLRDSKWKKVSERNSCTQLLPNFETHCILLKVQL